MHFFSCSKEFLVSHIFSAVDKYKKSTNHLLEFILGKNMLTLQFFLINRIKKKVLMYSTCVLSRG